MSEGILLRHSPRTVALIGNYVPRRCGIATFTADLARALREAAPRPTVQVVAMNDVPQGYEYPEEVNFEVNDRRISDYQMAADFLNMNQVGVACVQHEYGIYGGRDGAHLLALLRNLRMPVVSTLHTVLFCPSPGQRAVLQELGRLSERLVVMSEAGREILRGTYGVEDRRIACIPHGIPDLPFVDPNYYKDQFGVEGRKVILTFGLLSPGKGIEYMIEALPAVVERHRDVVYVVLGATHPRVKRESGESYRLTLQQRIRELGMQDHVVFHNRFVEPGELYEFLGAADIYVTPYLNREQVTSGTLVYALGAGKATVSTPYRHAEELLADGRGRLVPFCDSGALAEQILDLLDNETERHAIRKRAYNHCRSMTWPQVGRRYLDLFAAVIEERHRRPRPRYRTRTVRTAPREMPHLRLDHLRRMTDDVGILQHCRFTVPDRHHGYCTDDNARALMLAVEARDLVEEHQALEDVASRYLSFVCHAFDPERGRFRNFLGYDRRWLERQGSEDSNGRAVWSLGTVVALDPEGPLEQPAVAVLERAMPELLGFDYPRSWAFGALGVAGYLRRFQGDTQARRILEELACRLADAFRQNARDDWPWLENVVTYDNGRLPQALLAAGHTLDREDLLETGLKALDWLVRIQTSPEGYFVPVGNRGWFRRGGERARFDQQPIEAQSMIEACLEAYRVTREEDWIHRAHVCLDWFFGRNDLGEELYDYRSGGCRDGLTTDGANLNQGAESTLAWLLSLTALYRIRGMLEADVASSRETEVRS